MNGDRTDARVAWLLVAGQLGLIALIVLLDGGAAWSVPTWLDRLAWVGVVLGLVVMLLGATGLRRGLTAVPLPNPHAQLRTTGAYRFVRHPMYSGLLLFAIAHTVVSSSGVHVVLCVLLVALISVKARWEERRLAARFAGYADYAAATPRFVPFLPAARIGRRSRTPCAEGARPER
jgi:protein-S-isoprenylcysteine O-methyltransferase Ste14